MSNEMLEAMKKAEERFRKSPIKIRIEKTGNLLFDRYEIHVSKSGIGFKEPLTAFTLEGAKKKGRKRAEDAFINPRENKTVYEEII